MIKKILLVLGVFAFAFTILSISILESSAIVYPSVGLVDIEDKSLNESCMINYYFPMTGKVLPDNPLWTLKALRDRVWYLITSSPLKKAELALLFSDKRLISTKTLFEKDKPDIALSTLTKGEKYLEVAVDQEKIARGQGFDTTLFLDKLAMASLKHYEVMQNFMPLVPEQGKPLVIATENYSKNTYTIAKEILSSKGLGVPNCPFDWDN